MPRNGAGSYNLVAGNPVVTNTTISSSWANNTLSDIASALTQSVAKDGQTVMTNNLPMGGFKLTNLGAGTNAGDSVRYQQLFSQGVPLDIASAATTDIGGQNTAFLNVTGTVGITSFGTNYNGPRILTFASSLTITNNSTTLILPLGQNIVTQAGDVAIVVPKSTVTGTPDGWRVASYLRYNDVPLVNDMQVIASAATLDFTASQAQAFSITGATTVTAVTMYEAQPIFAIAKGAFKLTNSTNLVVQGGADYTCTVNDVLMFIKDENGNVYVFGIPVRLENVTTDPTYASTSATKAATPEWVKGVSFGRAASSGNIAGSRLSGVTYYNTTNIPRKFKYVSVNNVSPQGATFTIAGNSYSAAVAGNNTLFVTDMIGPGESYSYTTTAGALSVWEER